MGNNLHMPRGRAKRISGAGKKYRKTLESTKAERLLEDALIDLEIPYRKEYVVRTAESFTGYYLVDFYLPKHKLLIEVDGAVHTSERAQWKDKLRTEAIKTAKPHLRLLRIFNADVERDPHAAVQKLITTPADTHYPANTPE